MGVWVAQPGWVPACWKLGGCERMEKRPEGRGAAARAWLLSPVLREPEHPGLEERPRPLGLTFLGSSFLGKGVSWSVMVVASVALSRSPAEEGAAMGSSHIDAKLGTCVSPPHHHPPHTHTLGCQLYEGKGPCLCC